MVDLTKPVQTRCGYKVRILCTDMEGEEELPVLVLVKDRNGYETVGRYAANGKYRALINESAMDLINVPARVSKFHSIGTSGITHFHLSGGFDAPLFSGPYVEIIYESGQPVDVKLHRT